MYFSFLLFIGQKLTQVWRIKSVFKIYIFPLNLSSCVQKVLKNIQTKFHWDRMKHKTFIEVSNIFPTITLMYLIIKPEHDKIYNITWAPCEVSDQTAHPRSQIRVFPVRLRKLHVFDYTYYASDLIYLGDIAWYFIFVDRFTHPLINVYDLDRL